MATHEAYHYIRADRATSVVLVAMLALSVACGGPRPLGSRPLAALGPIMDGRAAEEILTELATVARHPGSPGFNTSLDRIAGSLENAGFVRLTVPPPDGPALTDHPEGHLFVLEDPLPYEVWLPGEAELEILGAEQFMVADTRRTPMALAISSRPTPPEGVLTRMMNLGNGTYPAEYEGVDVRGAVVYGRQPALSIYRAAVIERGALGVVSPSAPIWQDTDNHPDLVAVGRVGSQGVGFKISTEMANRVEDAMARSGGEVPVRVTVRSALNEAGVLRTLVAEIPGAADTPERVALIAPFSGPAPGAGDVSGAAALLEAAVSLRAAIVAGKLPRPRRTILFIWGALLQGTSSWARHYPVATEQLHSATVVQLIAGSEAAAEPSLRVERVPDPGARWTRPPDAHTPWGAAPPPHWPFEGHYLSDLTLAIARQVAPLESSWSVDSHPYEGGADHSVLLEDRIPAQRLWHFPDPLYRSSHDVAGRLDRDTLRRTALASAAIAYELALADGGTARRLVRFVEQQARTRMDSVMTQAGRNRDATDADGRPLWDRRLEEQIANAWKKWYLEAVESVMAHPLGSEGGQLRGIISITIGRLNREWDAIMLDLGLAPLPLPERFLPRRTVTR